MPKKLAQLAEATNPKYLSMVKTPANRSGFKIIRKDNDTSEADFTPTRTRARKDSNDGMLYIALPSDFTEEQASEVMDRFGLEEDYELVMDEGQVRLIRKDQSLRSDIQDVSQAETVAIRLDKEQSIIAHVSTETFKHTNAQRSDTKIGGAVLSGIEFEGHSDRDVEKFLAEHNLDIPEENIERIDEETYYVSYKKSDKAHHTDRINLADGVNARVYRAETNDIPESIARGIVEECYGSYGYGQLDFFAALTDELYTDAAYDAVRTLGDILREITIWSGLNLSSRIDLMNNALSQYGFYMAELMNSLPRSVVSAMTSDISKTSDKEDTNMAGETKKDEAATEKKVETKRSDEAVIDKKVVEEVKDEVSDTSAAADTARADSPEDEKTGDDDEAAKAPEEEVIKRSEVQAMIDAAVAAAVSAVREDKVESKEDVSDKKESEAADAGDDTAKREDDAITKLAASVESLATKVEEMGDTSTVRYDNGSAAGTDPGSVFQGAIFGK